MLLLSLRPDDLLTIPGMALSIDSMRFVSSAHAILATGGLTFTLVGLLPLNTSAFCWTCDWAPCLPEESGSSKTRIMVAAAGDRIDGWVGLSSRP